MEPLADPLGDRVVEEVPPPPHRFLDSYLLFPRTTPGKPDWKVLRDHLKIEGRVSKADCMQLVGLAVSLFRRERTLIELKDPVTIVGDIHGQFYDMLRMFELGGDVESTKYLFLGDYVDRGSFSIEVVLMLYALKINYPNTVFLLRGNHECRQMTSFFNFREECLHKYDEEIYCTIMESFDTLPLSCIVNNKFLAVHGGISPELSTLDDISRIQRFQETPRLGIYCDLLWSDPVDSENGQSPDQYKNNEVRGCSFYYNVRAVNNFLKRNRLLSVIRAHEAQLDGYKMHRWNGNSEFPVVITIFSAPNYCDVYNNKGAIIKFNNNNLNIQQFNYTAHPYILPNFMNIFTWSIPFVIEKVLAMLFHLIQARNGEDGSRDEIASDRIRKLQSDLRESKVEVFRNKVKAVSKMMKMFKFLREEKELILELKGLCPDNRVPRGLLIEGKEAVHNAIQTFEKAKQFDLINERRPD
jgi:serine/threonine-protein phosphatase 2B catalytic subunit